MAMATMNMPSSSMNSTGFQDDRGRNGPYYSSYERPISLSPSLEPLDVPDFEFDDRTPTIPIILDNYQPTPPPQPREQPSKDLPAPSSTDKPDGYYAPVQRPITLTDNPPLSPPLSPLVSPPVSLPVKSSPPRKVKPPFTFGCLPNNKLRERPQQELYSIESKTESESVAPSAKARQARAAFGYYPSYERVPDTTIERPVKQSQSKPQPATSARIQEKAPIRQNPRGQYPDYEVSY